MTVRKYCETEFPAAGIGLGYSDSRSGSVAYAYCEGKNGGQSKIRTFRTWREAESWLAGYRYAKGRKTR
ncbi:MAG: hypothetical protein OXC65_14995 [Thiotrichales bacterium]|nr:hypothetical protein [Thiotrichales bacterium]